MELMGQLMQRERSSRITGVGIHKLKAYGGAFTDAIRDFCQRNAGCAG